jgi:multicomponent Na+:H+ antiporter subunit F
MNFSIFYTLAAVIFMISLLLILIRALRGPTTYDRILAVNVFGSNIVLAICLIAFLQEDLSYIDVALLYALVNFISTIALLRFFKNRSFNDVE